MFNLISYFCFMLISSLYSQNNSSSYKFKANEGDNTISDSLALYYPLQVGNTWYYHSVVEHPGGVDSFYTLREIRKDTTLNGKVYSILDEVVLISGDTTRLMARFDSITGNYYELNFGFSNELLIDSTHCNISGTYTWGTLYLYNATIFGLTLPCRRTANLRAHVWGIGHYYNSDVGWGISNRRELVYARINGNEYGALPLSVIVKDNIYPSVISLSQNYPNPFNPITTITYYLLHKSLVLLEVYNILGESVSTLVRENKVAGKHSVSFDGSQLPSGMYFYRLNTDGFVKTNKMLLVK